MTPLADTLTRLLADAEVRSGHDVAMGALAIAAVEYPRLDPQAYLARLDAIGEQALDCVARAAGADGPVHARVEAVNQCLYGELGFRGNRDRYADVRNSCLNQVIDRRTGIPITMSLVYMATARRAGLRAEGINFPGHFLARVWDGATGSAADGLVVDPFDGGAVLTEQDCRALLARQDDGELTFRPALLVRASRRQMFVRMLANLKRLYVQNRSFAHARTVTDALLALTPSSLQELRDRGLLSYHLHDFAPALRDLEDYLKLVALTDRGDDPRDETTQVWDHVKALRQRLASLN
ncbi:MAG: transglutaminase-like domain-containing protein [Acidobacteriota bacterium]